MQSVGNRNLPSYALLRSFECAARHESFTQAAEELHLTQSAVSKQVKELEETIGVTMFRRVGRRVTLTEAGSRFAADLGVDLENLKQSVARAIAAGRRNTTLRIGVLPTFASRWMIPRLGTFLNDHPSIEIRLETRTVPFNLTQERFDLAIHFGKANWPDARLNKLFDEEMLPVASPKFRDRYLATEPAHIAEAPLLHLITRESAWVEWFAMKGITAKRLMSGRHFDQFSMIISAAVSSIGAALIPRYLIELELECGALIPLSGTPLKTHNSYFAVSPAGDVNPQVNAFTRWLMSTARRASMKNGPE
ncbi:MULTISPECIES: LysR substrate-binding domain-containing protein [Sinorhizobium]|uniref:Transcriptional regulator n=1 Tax=Sinorhizobium americanum TaxID=194963 RepID=A0A2S3YND1_9HYPH|nr:MULTISPECIES: LysR substrate-binding domain-containing protein [Sinorhizobium]PDT33051.1 transcriptional regulator [Sinorhizobium sp. FG01]PDT47719.1 transcriptional regulator [Sinorhizobium sp. NG07B]POH29843.1 transcriptional regulator [Sinorhizobium americanum]POH30536.1 transcriptional regulator [Sinorhizobium americanum]